MLRSIVPPAVLTIVVSVVIGGVIPPLVVAQQQAAASSSEENNRLIVLAQTWLGGVKRVAAVKSLELVGPEITERVLFPDRYQTIDQSGQMQASFDSQTLWHRPAAPRVPTDSRAAALAPQAARAAPPAEEQRQAGLRRVSRYAVLYLLRTLPTYPMTVRRVADAACGLPGACLEFRSADATLFVVIDPVTGQPRARVEPVSGPRGTAHDVTLLDDYRVVNELRVPHRERRQFRMPDGTVRSEDSQVVYRAIRVDPPLTPADFVVRVPR